MENPYTPPTADIERTRVSTWVKGVRVVAALLVVQGVSECGIGLLLIFRWKTSALAFAIVLLVFLLGGLKVIAGVRNYRYRNRVLGILALAVAPLSVFTLFCLPSALALLVCGLVVYLNGDVRRVFASGSGPM